MEQIGRPVKTPQVLAAPEAVADYFQARFWDDFYFEEFEPFEWYHPYAMIRGIIRKYAAEDDLIINLGCGNSRLAEDMVEDGYENLMNIDFSRIVIQQMNEKFEDPEILAPAKCEFVQLDITDMSVDPMANEIKRGIPNGTYDVALDKGTLDSMFTSEQADRIVKKALHEIDRILKPDGVYIIMSYNTPDMMLPYLDSTDDVTDVEDFYGWEVSAHQIAKPTIDKNKIADLFDSRNTYFIYVCIKDEDRSAEKEKYRIFMEKQKLAGEEKGKRDKMKARGRK
mmetsp:Transcript_21543/g.25464  ORF Transcript_21543/g.25464 Transcript_21543/m.25464 type:complete len:282 (-) Transcript_21543:99-944(-)